MHLLLVGAGGYHHHQLSGVLLAGFDDCEWVIVVLPLEVSVAQFIISLGHLGSSLSNVLHPSLLSSLGVIKINHLTWVG